MNNAGDIDKIYTWLKHGCYQRTLHYHNTPKKYESLYAKQLDYICWRYETVSLLDVQSYLKTGIKKKHPGIMIGAFDGYRNNYDVLNKLLVERKLKGWYLLVTDFLNTPAQMQESVLTPYQMQWFPDEYDDGRYAMNWEEAAEIGRDHTIVNHTSRHFRLTEETDIRTLQYEIIHAHGMIMEKIGKAPDIISWLGGACLEKNAAAEKMLRQYGYHYQIGYRLEYFDENDREDNEWEIAIPDGTAEKYLDREIRRYEQIISNIGWYSAVPSILPLYQKGYLITDGGREEDRELAAHYAALVKCLVKTRKMDESAAAWQALEVLAVNGIGEGFQFH